MGKARIVSGGTDGLYQVEVLHRRDHIEAELESIQERIDDLTPKIEEANEAFEYADLEVQEATITVNALIDQWEEEGDLPPVDLEILADIHNLERTSRGLGALTALANLNQAAQGHADWLAQNDTSGHTGAGGSTAAQRAALAGYTGSVGENVAVGVLPPEDEALDRWMKSPGHRANVLNKNFKHFGLGYACRGDGRFQHFWVVVFGVGGGGTAQTPMAPSNCTRDGEADVPELIRDALVVLAEASAERSKIEIDRAELVAQQLSLSQRATALQAVPADPTQAAWCADHSDGLAGEVAAAEIPGEGNARVILRPGFADGAAYQAARDGQLFHRQGQSPAQVFFNAAVLPGVQKWKPTYRVGALTSVDDIADTCTVALDNELSSAYDLPINQATTIANVPIVYMACNAEVFEVGDRVLVEFIGRDWGSPRVIGFESNPKPCDLFWPDVSIRVNIGRSFWNKPADAEYDKKRGPPKWRYFCEYWRWGDGLFSQNKMWYQWTRDAFLFLDTDRVILLDTEDESEVFGIDLGLDDVTGPDHPFWTATENISLISGPEGTIDRVASFGANLHINFATYRKTDSPTYLAFTRWNCTPMEEQTFPDAAICAGDGSEPTSVDAGTQLVCYSKEAWSSDPDIPRPPPGWVAAENPPFRLSYFGNDHALNSLLTIEEEEIVLSSDLAAIKGGLIGEGLPATLALKQTVDSVEYLKTYNLTVIERRDDEALNQRPWFARYAPQA